MTDILADTSIVRTGGASGIGLAAVKILTSKGSKAFILDLAPPEENVPAGATFIRCDTTSWDDLKRAYAQAAHVDIAIANAGVSEEQDYLEDQFDSAGELLQPRYDKVIDVNLRGVLDFVKLARSYMKRQGGGGSIVITSSATAYAPEQSLPVYSAVKHAVGH
jgi:NAD(P)-dependent dehydrogenase (short-subunit alcohol dehydrogenase family)